MFKSLLYTIPTISGNITLCSVLNDNNFNSSTGEYDSFIKSANMVPLQNNIIKEPILVNLLEGNWEYDIAKFYNIYESSFYNENFNVMDNDYEKIDLYNEPDIHQRDKNYEFGCKRLNYHFQNYQFSFYAPFYIDNVNDIPDSFKLQIEFDNKTTKVININIGNNPGGKNYLYNYLNRYVNKIDDKIIYLLPESKQCSCNGINVKLGGFSLIKDNKIGTIYDNQMTINLFDYTISETFKRCNLIIKQVIPLSFAFNISDFLEGTEKRLLKNHSFKIKGNYYKNGVKLSFFAFKNNYINYQIPQQYFKYDENKHNYELISTTSKGSLTDKNYPSLHEAKFFGYKYTNKLNTMYCPWKLKYSSDNNPYIFNMTFAFKNCDEQNNYINSNIYGNFPIFIDTIQPKIVNNPNNVTDVTLSYIYNGDENLEVFDNENEELEKYYIIRNNHVCDWFTPYYEKTFFNDENWAPITNDKCFYKGILYNLSYFNGEIDNFGVFLNFDIGLYDKDNIENIKTTKYIISQSDKYNAFADFSNNNYVQHLNNVNSQIDISKTSYDYINIETNCIMTKQGILSDISYYVPDSTNEFGGSYWLDEDNYNLDNYYVDYSSKFMSSRFSYDNSGDDDNENGNYGYVKLEISYTNLPKPENININNSLSNIYVSRNSDNNYTKISNYDEILTYINDNNSIKYSLYKRYRIKEDQTGKYAYIPLYNDGNNIYSGALIEYTSYDSYLYVYEYDMNKFVTAYNSIYENKITDINLDYNYSKVETTYGRFIDKKHLEKFPFYLSRNKDDELPDLNLYNQVYVRKRHIDLQDEKYEIFDTYEELYKVVNGGNLFNEQTYNNFISTLKDTKDGVYFVDENGEKYDLFFYKRFFVVTKQLYDAIYNNEQNIPIQLFIRPFNDYENITEEFGYSTDSTTERISIDKYLIPAFSNIYINENTKNDMLNLALSGNVYSEYDTNYENIEYMYFNKYQYTCMISLKLWYKQNTLGYGANNILNTPFYKLEDNVNISTSNIDNVLSFFESKDIEYKTYELSNIDKLISFTYNDKKYVFYYINIYCTNTKNTFRFNDLSCMLFFSINGNNYNEYYDKNKLLSNMIPYMNANIFGNLLSKISTIIIPSTFRLLAKYVPVIHSSSKSFDRWRYPTSERLMDEENNNYIYNIVFTPDSKQMINLNRYTDFISPLITKVDKYLYDRYYKLFKLTDDAFDENNIREYNLDIFNHDKIKIGESYDKLNHTSIITEYDPVEYKHFQDNKLFNLEESFKIHIDKLLSYEELLEYESFESTYNVFRNRILKYNKNIALDDKNTILFLYNRYNINYISVSKQLNTIKTKKLYDLTYSFSLK